ncbi:RidA family protein [Halogranum rubrum]|uniref:Uncharacterized protein n=1 Tax=Halogranum salarium B-1 TaxID=1210908 RepID=J2ZXE7_9EURY|nr:RidA family protein [Halogranum salarium]EJN57673.1 hypothetical protein HSB1_40340 [Halogranum salarium B-1]
MSDRREYSTGTTWEETFGYSRAVRIGDQIRVSGTSAVEDGEVVGVDDPYQQARHILETIGESLAELDAGPEDVILTRIYVADFSLWEPIGDAHREFFGDVRPATTLIEVETLPRPELLLEIEAEAVNH